MAIQTNPDKRQPKHIASNGNALQVQTDLPNQLEVTEAEQDLLEANLSDLVADLLRQSE